MKRTRILIVLLLFFQSMTVFANDGSLQIDTNIQPSVEWRDTAYIEQETGLSQLFSVAVTEKIAAMQSAALAAYKADQRQIFTYGTSRNDIVAFYQTALFASDAITSTNGRYRITLNNRQRSVTWQMVMLLIGGFMVMGWSLYNVMKRKKINDG